MITNHTVEYLREFEQDIANEFNAGKIRAPIHLEGGNEQQLLDIFKEVNPKDWICVTWRSHLKCLLKGVPPSEVKAAIMAGKSITLCFPEHRVISSAIVGGIVPIALGLAWAAKHRQTQENVWCFIGDMSSRTGVLNECDQYATGHNLPLRFVMEDNELSVCTNTEKVWGKPTNQRTKHISYYYKLPWPHSGAGKRVEF